MKMSPLDRVLILLTGLLAAYQIVVGIDNTGKFSIIAYTVAFGVLLVAELLLFILGLDVLELPIVVIISTIIPLSLATGLVWEYLASFGTACLILALIGFAAVVWTRSMPRPSKLPIFVLTVVHGFAGLIIFLLPLILSIQGATKPAFVLVGLGGALISLEGLLLSALKMGRPFLSSASIRKFLPALLLVMTICFVVGFKFG